mmetsp:Transcript_15638/g.21402  ORF Transcript_15638/g.21402 Transcript_15638/m.21402 type:complete len:428 (-) Transcript_15638:229-1512(-)
MLKSVLSSSLYNRHQTLTKPQKNALIFPKTIRCLSSSSNENNRDQRLEQVLNSVKRRGGSNAFATWIFDNFYGPDKDKNSVLPIPYSSSIPHAGMNALSSVEENPLFPHSDISGKKVSIVGCGQVGLAAAFAILNQGTTNTLAITDINADRVDGEVKDLRQGSAFYGGSRARIVGSTDYAVTADSDLAIVTAGAAQKPGESRLSLLGRNIDIMKSVIPQILEHSPDASICIVANPCDIMTAIAAKVAGPDIPAGRIFGSGTVLDSSRLQTVFGATFDIDARDARGYVIGEHGDSSVPVFSSLKIGGVGILQNGNSPEPAHLAMHHEVVDSAGDIIKKKGYTNWAVGMACSKISQVVLHDERRMLTVSTCVRGFHGIEEDVFLSMPCVVGAGGINRVVNLPLTDWEIEKLQLSATKLWEVQSEVWDKI